MTLELEGLWLRLRLLRSKNQGWRWLITILRFYLLVARPNFLRLVTAFDLFRLFDGGLAFFFSLRIWDWLDAYQAWYLGILVLFVFKLWKLTHSFHDCFRWSMLFLGRDFVFDDLLFLAGQPQYSCLIFLLRFTTITLAIRLARITFRQQLTLICLIDLLALRYLTYESLGHEEVDL